MPFKYFGGQFPPNIRLILGGKLWLRQMTKAISVTFLVVLGTLSARTFSAQGVLVQEFVWRRTQSTLNTQEYMWTKIKKKLVNS